MKPTSDDAIVQLEEEARHGDATAFAQLVEQQRGRYIVFIRRIAGEHLLSKVEPDDLLQEALSAAMQGLPEVAGDDLDPNAWMFGLLRRRVIDAHRHHFGAARRDASRGRSLDAAFDGAATGNWADVLAASMTTPSAALSRDMKLMRLRNAIESLDPVGRDAVRLRYVEGLPSKEIAERLGKSDAAMRVLLSRTVKKLQAILGETPG